MAVKIRLTRGGAKKRPYYRIVIADARAPRDGAFLEKVGTYDPMISDAKSKVTLDKKLIELWLSRGALPTDRVAKFIDNAGIALPQTIAKKIEIKKKAQKQKPSKKEQKDQKEQKEAK